MSPVARRVPAAQRRLLIEEAATRLFAHRGFRGTTVDAIAAAAGVTKPMLYRHFESKQELWIALVSRGRADLVAAPLGRFRLGADDLDAQLGAMVDAWLEHVEQHPDATRLIFTAVDGDGEVQEAQRELFARQRATHEALLREFVPDLDPLVAGPLAEAVRASLGAVALWWLEHPEVPRTAAASALMRVLRGSVVGDGTGRSSDR